ncbi:hypothetical protein P280DRAFT_286605 [Massarina eburnea CBS 473.64]|uniref:Uncharacterized protein n=1 Tax=Massarina eburnea CBS 473.64 TaxID=1395130 RepID=A0A6A6S2U3_9PLEO|nr:hypothetical protein P280DRAFT_286605 [Massarina eburnea CBS 473.64]
MGHHILPIHGAFTAITLLRTPSLANLLSETMKAFFRRTLPLELYVATARTRIMAFSFPGSPFVGPKSNLLGTHVVSVASFTDLVVLHPIHYGIFQFPGIVHG